jgi:hypothetical protein
MSKDPVVVPWRAQTQPNFVSLFHTSKVSGGSSVITKLNHSQERIGGARRDRTDDILLAKQALSQLSYGPIRYSITEPVLVGPGRLELPTSRLSGVRSNHLSYGPPGIRLDPNLLTDLRQASPASRTKSRSA